MGSLPTKALLVLLAVGVATAATGLSGDGGLGVGDDGRVRASFHDADLRDVLREFARAGKFQLVLDDSVRGRVNAELDDVPLEDALRAILRTHRFAAEIDGRPWTTGTFGDNPEVVRVSPF